MRELDDWLAERRGTLRAAGPERAALFERAAAALPGYLAALDLRDTGPLTGSPLSPNVLREVRRADGSAAVLKLIGEPQHAEAATLAAWTAGGVPCAPLLDHGTGTHAPGVTHLLLGLVAGTELPHAQMAAATGEAAALYRRAHLAPPAGVLPLPDFLGPRLDEAAGVWRAAGLPAPDGAAEVLTALSAEPVLLHGDAVGFNLLRTRAGLALIDPAGVHGPAEFDAARWVARCLAVTGPAALPELTATALRADPSLEPRAFDACVAVELVIEVRHRITSPQVFLRVGAPRRSFDADTRLLAGAALDRLGLRTWGPGRRRSPAGRSAGSRPCSG
ncbi:aminoglycoside phosphotransferase family protein [Kitasatospora sp. NPDC057198]|uniref:aminoglycoside phosphotransferase family protein n=1 Tax=Kitasatospora sp. NPDC057198 TaxID=3346046 RepID=UPI00363662EA